MSEQTTIRINIDTRDRLKTFGSTGQSMDGIINDLLERAEKAGTIPAQVPGLNTGFNDELTRLNDKYTNVVKSIHELNDRLDNLIPGIEHQRDESGHALEMVYSIQKRLEALEACPVVTPQTIPETAQEQEKIPDDEHRAPEIKEIITITDEMRKELTDKIKACGMDTEEIASYITMGASSVRKIYNEKNPQKTIRKADYDFIMSLPSQIPSQKG